MIEQELRHSALWASVIALLDPQVMAARHALGRGERSQAIALLEDIRARAVKTTR